MIARYTRPEMGALWSDESKYRTWLEVELAVVETLAARGLVPEADLKRIRERAGFDVARIDAIEAEVKHDVIAFLTSVAEKVGPASRHVHYGLTSSDVVDTAQALLLVRAADRLLGDLDGFREVLKRRASCSTLTRPWRRTASAIRSRRSRGPAGRAPLSIATFPPLAMPDSTNLFPTN